MVAYKKWLDVLSDGNNDTTTLDPIHAHGNFGLHAISPLKEKSTIARSLPLLDGSAPREKK
jgi:hypothetical protein